MIPSSLVPVAGVLARPRVAPLDHVPSFGRDWTFRGAPGARPGKHCLATLATSCIDVGRPHRACHWKPLPMAAPAPTLAGSVVARPAAAAPCSRRFAGGFRDRRAKYAICWSIGALGIIGWLIAAHEPIAGFGPAYAIHAAGGVPDHATSSSGTVRVAAVQPHTSTSAPPQRKMAAPVATTAESPPATHHVKRRPASLRPKATSSVPPTATAASPRSSGKRMAAAPARTPAVSRLATRPPPRSSTVDARTRDRLAASPRATGDTRDSLEDPLTLIAMANALRTTQPARATHAPATGLDWTAQLSHRRLTDTPDAFAR
ncbi:hypothetical protein [Burkholderia lata]|uniref:Uncharacterized protein n=1 Tax=Burkholderia lata (strain ATCC 17760 / DSM 23089 / LMG 22485 / NCIMB 9086 / R18194 / 383) TaxID=482957 RepID=Q39II0_BURL3|nr:hypothetical protein [Burkholderia lata]ABB07736.1 hypothetical protein Bcep18194_A4139 [Burkholderia lata]